MTEYEVVFKATVNRVYIIQAESEAEAEAEAQHRYEEGHDGDSMSESIVDIRVEVQ